MTGSKISRGLRFPLAALLALTLGLVWSSAAMADAGNPILNTIKASVADPGAGGAGTVTISVRGQWDWLSHGSDCNFNRAATGVGIIWQDLNGPGTSRGSSEVQRITIVGGPTGGTFRLKFDGEKTANIAFNATAAQVDAALELLPNLGAGSVNVTGGPGPGTPYDVAFTQKGDQPAIGLDNKSFTGGSGTNVTFATTTAGTNPVFNGYLVEKDAIRAYIGTSTASVAGTFTNPKDRMVHPVDIGNVPESYPGAAGQVLVDPPLNPTTGLGDHTAWKGGCGREPLTATASQAGHPETSGQTCADTTTTDGNPVGTADCSGRPWGSWGYQLTFSHTYLKQLPNNGGSGLPEQICANFYDVHGGGSTPPNFQKVNNLDEITVDEAGDNSIDTNSFNVLNGANCITVSDPLIVTTATNGTVGDNISDSALLSNVPAGAGGTMTFSAYKRTGASPDCTGTAAFTSAAIPVNGPGTYGSGNFNTGGVGAGAGTYDWIVHYTGSGLVLPKTTVCGDQTGGNDETSDVLKKQPSLTTDAGGTRILRASGTILFDVANLSGGFNPTGTITFTLYKGADCSPGNLIATVGIGSGSVAGNGSYRSQEVPVTTTGQYRWIANYSGDSNNFGTANTCNGTNENVRVIAPGIHIDKSVTPLIVHQGDTVTYTIVVTNSGDSDLTGVFVDDNTFPQCDRTAAQINALITAQHPTNDPGVLESTQALTYTCTAVMGAADVTNVATTTGTSETGHNVTDTDDASVDVIHPHILIEKSLGAGQSPTPTVGTTVTFHIQVTNDGDTPLSNIVITDANAPGCARNPLRSSADGLTGAAVTLAPAPAAGSTAGYDCTLANVPITFTGNLAEACGTDQLGAPNGTVCDDDDVPVTPQKARPTLTTNAGATKLLGFVAGSTVDLTDTSTLSGGFNPTGTITFTLYGPNDPTCASPAAGTNSKTVTGNSPPNYVSDPITVSAPGLYRWIANYGGDTNNFATSNLCNGTDENVLVIRPEIDVTKNPKQQSIPSGGTANFTIVVTNNGDARLTGIVVTDAQAPDCDRTAAQTAALSTAQNGHAWLDPTESFTYNCSKANVTAPFVNVVEACGDAPVPPGGTVCDTDTTGGGPPGCPEPDRCGSVTISNLTTEQDFKPRDTGTLSGLVGTPGGTLTFNLFTTANCAAGSELDLNGGAAGNALTAAVNANGAYTVEAANLLSVILGTTNTDGTYYWQVSYSGNGGATPNAAITGNCGTENFTIDND